MSVRRDHCRDCGVPWSEDAFYVSTRAMCKECAKRRASDHHWRTKGNKTAERWRLVDDLRAMGIRQCKRCESVRPLEAYGRAATTRDGLSYSCKHCCTTKNRRTTYGLDAAAQRRLLDSQGGACAVCSAPITLAPFSAHLDHDHRSGVVRGFLCPACNKGLGNFRDDADSLFNAALYVLAHQKEAVNVA